LRLHEIYNLDLQASLVVLSACQTGVGKEVRGEGMIGITHGFMYAGVPQVVVSLWKVDDRSTAELMKRFYHQLLEEGQFTDEALQKAQISMLRDPQWSHPRHWSGFIFQGDFRVKPNGDIEAEDVGEAGTATRAKSDMPPPKVAPDDPPMGPRPPGGDRRE
jgi:CHAT domain-containing protein